jgi:hypothetical protein
LFDGLTVGPGFVNEATEADALATVVLVEGAISTDALGAVAAMNGALALVTSRTAATGASFLHAPSDTPSTAVIAASHASRDRIARA